MTRSTKVSYALVVLALAAGSLPVATVSAAEDPYDGTWHFSLTPYLWTPNINGSVDARIPTRSTGAGGGLRQVNLSTKIEPNDYLENLEFGAMLIGEARKGDWSVFTDFFYVDFGDQSSQIRHITGPDGQFLGARERDVTIGVSATMWTMAGAYTVARSPMLSFDVLAGFRYLGMDTSLKYTLRDSDDFLDTSGKKSLDASEWDGILGVKGQLRLDGGRWFMPYYADVGTGSSNWTWQALVGLAYGFGWGDVNLSVRSLSYDFDDNDANIRMTGPALGASFRW